VLLLRWRLSKKESLLRHNWRGGLSKGKLTKYHGEGLPRTPLSVKNTGEYGERRTWGLIKNRQSHLAEEGMGKVRRKKYFKCDTQKRGAGPFGVNNVDRCGGKWGARGRRPQRLERVEKGRLGSRHIGAVIGSFP